MEGKILTERLRLHIELALNRDCACKKTLAKLDRRADRLGLTGVEVDAARQLHSFDIRIAAAIDFMAVSTCWRVLTLVRRPVPVSMF